MRICKEKNDTAHEAEIANHTQPFADIKVRWTGIKTSYSASETVDASYGRKMHYLQGSLEDASSTGAAGFNGAPLWWVPEDGSWCVGNYIYARSVYVGGSASCIQEIIDDPRVQSYPVAPTHKISAEDR